MIYLGEGAIKSDGNNMDSCGQRLTWEPTIKASFHHCYPILYTRLLHAHYIGDWHHLYSSFSLRRPLLPYLFQDAPLLFKSTHLGMFQMSVQSRTHACWASPAPAPAGLCTDSGTCLPQGHNRVQGGRIRVGQGVQGSIAPQCLARFLPSLRRIINHLLLLRDHGCNTN